ncbi:TonB-dependent siderophore receptor [Synoicihabitans lomoniglobus]|uniref:TonB-dependent receptor plug domain-containing protein n=1 Tax=Synoicihabitans lomoniglobus TaxID=2909285 RepID=A0AAF0I437_9BACT|nr:hypothetical protein [Opitutaceae bacterium LMO-M01]WED66628.1 hypothetical protein PXH66_07165 [Opitutaceae bacterium LMO-M01]
MNPLNIRGERIRILGSALASLTLASGALAQATSTTDEEVLSLEAFILEESNISGSDTLLQNSRPIGSVFLGEQDALGTPRSITVLTPEAMKQFSVKGFDDLDRVGAGLTRPNIFGIPGLPFIRGDNAGVYFNGMRRIPNQNETPTSFGSLESMDLVKGPSPAQFGPTNSGGYVNFVPKTPYFDKFRGSVEVTIGDWNYYNTQIDVGGPVLVAGKPMAYRLSVTNQDADSYYNDVGNDYISVYAAAKAKLSENLSVFGGAEYYSFQSNENAGWNRVTQALIDNGDYIIGEMDPNTTSAAYGGFTDNDLISAFFPTQNAVALGVQDPNLALVVPTAYFLDAFGAPTGPNFSYENGAASMATPIFYNGGLYGYKYTQDYFDAGGGLFTEKIDGKTVLSDPSDYADSKTFIYFTDFVWQGESDRKISVKNFFEYITTKKLSSYGFAHDSDAHSWETKLAVDDILEIGGAKIAVQYGADVRYSYNNDANDFFVEPFNRRNIANPTITPQSIVLAGPQLDWQLVGGSESKLMQYGAFGQFKADLTESFAIYGGARVESANYSTRGTPKESPSPDAYRDGEETYASVSVNPILTINNSLSLYAAIQQGTALQPGQTGGINNGDGNFVEAPFYEGGIKTSLLDGKLFGSFAVYQFEKSTLADLPTGAVDESAYTSEGYEVEFSYAPTPMFTIVGSFGEQKATYDGGFPFATSPMTPEQTALYAGAIVYDVVSGDRYDANPSNERSGYPLFSANLFAVLTFQNGFGLGVGPSYKESFWLNDEHTLKLPEVTVWNANLFYRTDRYEVFLRLNNFTDEDYFIGASFAPTMIVTKAEPIEAQLSVKFKF